MTLLLLAFLGAGIADGPMPVDFAATSAYRLMQKPVLERRVLDRMESLDNWSLHGKGEFSLTTERFHEGAHAMRFRVKTRTPDDVLSASRRSFGTVELARRFGGEDWSRFNRISFWLYPDLPGWRVVNLRLTLRNDGAEKLPDVYNNDGNHSMVGLVNHQWNHVVWEIPYLPRDKVTALEFVCRRMGNEPEASDTLTFDIDDLALERVDADPFEGWGVAPGRIAFSHTGYSPGARKTAIATGLKAGEFRLVDEATGETVMTRAVEPVRSALGEFQVMDFSGYRTPGRYRVRAGELATQPFSIGDDVWRGTAWKIVNFFFTERCGFDVPGSHRICHRDWMAAHGDKRMPINGGWHDAGDLSQGLTNTSEAVYSMFALAEKARAKGDGELARGLIEEAKWGLDWVRKTTFHDGFRVFWATMGSWTDGVLGNNDDITAEASNTAVGSFLAASAEAIAARMQRQDDPDDAAYSLRLAREDWQFGMRSSAEQGADLIGIVGPGALASLDLWQATGEEQYARAARRFAALLVASQERGFQGRSAPITGYFYTTPAKKEILHYYHPGYSQAPLVALSRLCAAFPNDPEWMDWYSTLALHADFFLKAMASYTEPYGVLPNSIYREDEYLGAPAARQEAFRRQVLNGVPLGNHYRLKIFPVWFDFRGHYGTLLAEAKSLSAMALVRRDPSLMRLAETQLQWIVGRNPFTQSTMFGEGYDYPVLYSAMSGNLVGALPVGIETRGDRDIPYWPASNHPNWKEVWVHPAARWLWILSDLAQGTGPAEFDLTARTGTTGEVEIQLRSKDPKASRFSVRTSNVELVADPKAGVWRGRVKNPDSPWVAVFAPDGDFTRARDVTGSAFEKGR